MGSSLDSGPFLGYSHRNPIETLKKKPLKESQSPIFEVLISFGGSSMLATQVCKWIRPRLSGDSPNRVEHTLGALRF